MKTQTFTQNAAPPPLSVVEDTHQYLTFMLMGETYAMVIVKIKEIIEYGDLTSVPMMPEFVRGVINLRGSVVPVIDLAVRFGGNASEITRRSCIVIMEVADDDEGQQDVGVIVDSVNEVLEIPSGEIEPAPSFGARIRADFINGMGKVNDKFVIILNTDGVLSINEITQLTQLDQPTTESAAL